MWHSGVCFKRRYVMVYGIFAFFGICRPFSVDSPAKTERVWLFKVPIKERNVPLLISVIIIIALTGLDQLTKHLATVYLAPVGAMPFIPGVMELRYVLNDGAAFSMLADAEWGARVPHRRNGPLRWRRWRCIFSGRSRLPGWSAGCLS